MSGSWHARGAATRSSARTVRLSGLKTAVRDVTGLRGNDKTELRQAAFLAAVALWGNWTTAAEAAGVRETERERAKP